MTARDDARERVRAALADLPPAPAERDDDRPGGRYYVEGVYGDNRCAIVYAADLAALLEWDETSS